MNQVCPNRICRPVTGLAGALSACARVAQASRLRVCRASRPVFPELAAGRRQHPQAGRLRLEFGHFFAGLENPDRVNPGGSGTDLPPGPHALGR